MTRLVRFSNNAVSNLAANLTNVATSVSVTSGDGAKFPALSAGQYFMATLVKADGSTEVVKVTARSTDTLTIVRAAEPVAGASTAYAFSAGDRIEARLTAGVLSDEIDRLDNGAVVEALNKSANYTLTADDVTKLVRVTTTSGTTTITLPATSALTDDYDVIVAKVTSDANTVVIARTGSTDLINGATSYTIYNQWQSAWLIADRSTNTWTVISSGISAVNTVVDAGAGSGSASITLSGDPGSINNTALFIGGVYQQKSSYSISGTTLTAGGAIGSGVGYEVVWSAPLTVGTPSDGTVTKEKLSADLQNATYGFKNRIINGNMVIDQRNAGASVATTTIASSTYFLDRWAYVCSQASKFTVRQTPSATETGYATRVAAGFTNYLACTVGASANVTVGAADYFAINQAMEGFSTADFAWGTASAKAVTLSFWVNSSVTGTFGASIRNSAVDRSYPFTYTINSANTWEQKSVTIAGDTTGTWPTNSARSMFIQFNLGYGSTFSNTPNTWVAGNYPNATGSVNLIATNSATFYVTGVQLEKGSTATSFDFRPYGTELALCQRYYYRVWPKAATQALSDSGGCYTTTQGFGTTHFPVTMRTAPTALEQSGTAGDYSMAIFGLSSTAMNAVPAISVLTTTDVAYTTGTVASGLTANSTGYIRTVNANAYLGWSAEL